MGKPCTVLHMQRECMVKWLFSIRYQTAFHYLQQIWDLLQVLQCITVPCIWVHCFSMLSWMEVYCSWITQSTIAPRVLYELSCWWLMDVLEKLMPLDPWYWPIHIHCTDNFREFKDNIYSCCLFQQKIGNMASTDLPTCFYTFQFLIALDTVGLEKQIDWALFVFSRRVRGGGAFRPSGCVFKVYAVYSPIQSSPGFREGSSEGLFI